MRPHLPFNIRPVKAKRVRKMTPASAILATAAEPATSVKAERRPVRIAPSKASPSLKVLGRSQPACE